MVIASLAAKERSHRNPMFCLPGIRV
jgi:hypothetical protein